MAEIASSAAKRRRVVWSSTVGNALEWFDFAVFGPFAAVIGQQFFPKADAAASLLAVYGLLAIFGGLAPLVAGWLIELTADRMSPTYYMQLCLLLMLIGLAILPKYARAGETATMPDGRVSGQPAS